MLVCELLGLPGQANVSVVVARLDVAAAVPLPCFPALVVPLVLLVAEFADTSVSVDIAESRRIPSAAGWLP